MEDPEHRFAGMVRDATQDGYAFAVGCMLITLGLALLQAAGLVTGGIAGLALLTSYLSGLPLGPMFVCINLPFLAFAGWAMGRSFLCRTIVVNIGIALCSAWLRHGVILGHVHPGFAAIVGGTVTGMGILAIARHGASVGGTGAVTLWLQHRRGWNAGRCQCAIDVVILLLSLRVIALPAFGWSVLSALAMSGIMIVWHQPRAQDDSAASDA